MKHVWQSNHIRISVKSFNQKSIQSVWLDDSYRLTIIRTIIISHSAQLKIRSSSSRYTTILIIFSTTTMSYSLLQLKSNSNVQLTSSKQVTKEQVNRTKYKKPSLHKKNTKIQGDPSHAFCNSSIFLGSGEGLEMLFQGQNKDPR